MQRNYPKDLATRTADHIADELVRDAQKVTTILAFLEAGSVDQLLLSSDFRNARGLKKNGGPMLTKAGVSEATLGHILVDNSRRFLAFVSKEG